VTDAATGAQIALSSDDKAGFIGVMGRMIDRARQLRTHSTDVEKKLWQALRARQLGGYKFRRQHQVCGYYLDFACEAVKLAVELDGGQHTAPENLAYDAARTAALEQSGWRVLRFWNHEVMENIDGVVLTIHHALTRNHEG
jgi:very-short-patch-repair endonuclease